MLLRRIAPAALVICFALAIPAACQPSADSRPDRLYHIVFLRREPVRKALSKEEADRLQAAHMANIQAMAGRGVLVAAGPFEDTPPAISGVFFFATSTIDEARKVAAADPTVLEHRNTVDVMAWRGPAGIGDEYRRLHSENPKTPEGMGVHPFIILRRTGGQLDQTTMARRSEYWAPLRSAGKLVAAGEVEGDSSAVEILIFDRIADAEAASLVAADPAVRLGLLSAEAHRWWCAANVFPH